MERQPYLLSETGYVYFMKTDGETGLEPMDGTSAQALEAPQECKHFCCALPVRSLPGTRHMYELALYEQALAAAVEGHAADARAVRLLIAPLVPGIRYEQWFPEATEIHLIKTWSLPIGPDQWEKE